MLYSIQATISRRGNIVKCAARISTVQRYLRRVHPLSDYMVAYWDTQTQRCYRVTAAEFLQRTTKEPVC